MGRLTFLAVAVCISIGTSQPVHQPSVTLKVAPEEVLFRTDIPFVLECRPEENVAGLKFTWQKNGKVFELNSIIIEKENEGTLVFLNPTQNDEGTYQCFAEITNGIASTRIINVRRTFINLREVIPQAHKPVNGRPFKLECFIPVAYPKPDIKWMYQFATDKKISHSVLDKRITMSPDGSLWFSNVTVEDTSKDFKYVCVGSTPASDNEVVLAEHFINEVIENNGEKNGELVSQYTTGNLTAKVGEVTMIYCIYGGTPLAHPDWFKDGTNVNNEPRDRVTRYNRSAGKRLLIRDTWLTDEGTYTCVVDNEVGKQQNHSMYLTVVSSPQFTKRPPSIETASLSKDITIPCQVAGVPAPKLIWTYNAKPLPQNEKLIIKQSSEGNITISDLTIKNVEDSDIGYYGCSGFNDNGDVYAETLIVVS